MKAVAAGSRGVADVEAWEGLDRMTRRWWDAVPHVGLLLMAASGDAVNFTGALGLVMQDQPLVVLVVAVAALTAAAVGLMHFAGVSYRRHRSGGRGFFPFSAIALSIVWMLLGLSLLWLRMQGQEAEAPMTISSFGAPDAAPVAAGESSAHLALALLFLALFVATGAIAAWAGYGGYAPRQKALRRAHQRRRSAVADLRDARAALVALEATLEQHQAEYVRDEERYESALQACEGWAQELREQARIRMAVAVGDPAGTSALT